MKDFTFLPGSAPQHAKQFGLVYSVVVKGTGPISGFFSAFTDFFGKRSAVYEEKIKNSVIEALDDLKNKAEMYGANAVCDFKLQVTEASTGHGQLMVVAYGTACELPEPQWSNQ